MKFCSPLLFLLLVFSSGLSAQTPRIFFSDLESGPNVGGKSNNGAWVAIWGKGFGAERGASTVTVGGGAAVAYPVWTDSKITFQLGPAAKTGNIVVNLRGKDSTAKDGSSKDGSGKEGTRKEGSAKDAGRASNGVPFTVRAGKISTFFVSSWVSSWLSFQIPVE